MASERFHLSGGARPGPTWDILFSRTAMDKFGHDNLGQFCEIVKVFVLKPTFWHNFMFILHGLFSRSSNDTLTNSENTIFTYFTNFAGKQSQKQTRKLSLWIPLVGPARGEFVLHSKFNTREFNTREPGWSLVTTLHHARITNCY